MNKISEEHTFHIPVMGIGFTIDTPVKVAQFGISSVISLVDDMLMEKMREFYSHQLKIPYEAITERNEDYRAKRITAYLNLIDQIVKIKFEALRSSMLNKGSETEKYLEMLPDTSVMKTEFERVRHTLNSTGLQNWCREHLQPGSIDVNIMTKLDKSNYRNGEKLPVKYNDAYAALRGYAKSNLESSIVFSAGMNPGLYGYIENFTDFFPDKNGYLRKKITLKVSDYRSALIQGKFLAKKGLWVSEYRIESGLNCGGHVFSTQGYLMGPILEAFKHNRDELIQVTHALYTQSLKNKKYPAPTSPLRVKITAQGGVGTTEEHQLLLKYYELDSVGWGTPFLLVPEVTNVDKDTTDLLCLAKEEDLYTSDISPLGIPFNTVRGNTKDIERQYNVQIGKPGSLCTKNYLPFNNEFTEKPICTASSQYQKLKIQELNQKHLTGERYKKSYDAIINKSCLCVGLGTSALLKNNLDIKAEGSGVSICPGPNMAYFSEIVSLKEMINHIYGKINLIKRKDRPHVFVNELKIYIDFLKQKVNDASLPLSEKQIEYFITFQKNLNDGIDYYKDLFNNMKIKAEELKDNILNDLEYLWNELNNPGLIPIPVYSENIKKHLILTK